MLMIDANAEPIRNIPALKRIDIKHLGRRRVIPAIEVLHGYREPDPATYRYDVFRDAWILKGDI